VLKPARGIIKLNFRQIKMLTKNFNTITWYILCMTLFVLILYTKLMRIVAAMAIFSTI